MRHLKVITGFRLAWLLALLLSCSLRAQQESTQPNQQRARSLLNQMIVALGGQAYLDLQDSESEGRSGRFYQGKSESSTVFHRFWQWPDKERVEFPKQRDVVRLTLGGEIYEITFRGSMRIDTKKDREAQVYLERRRHSLEIVLRQWLAEAGTALFDEGPAVAENHIVERVTIINAQNDAVSLGIDTETHLPVKKTFMIRDPQGYRDEIGEVYDNWKTIQGISTPFNTLVTRNGELHQQYYLSTISYNNHLQDSLFSSSGPLFPKP